mgnify:CR=1 FL=1
MAAMSTSLTEFSNNGDTRTSSLTGHAVSQPQLVIEKRKVPNGSQQVAESTVSVVVATTDVDGAVMQPKYNFTVVVRSPIGGNSTDKALALSTLRDIVAGDEFANTLDTQEWL